MAVADVINGPLATVTNRWQSVNEAGHERHVGDREAPIFVTIFR
jgi:hypothetical protein